jgi:multidrug resistance efflux pump
MKTALACLAVLGVLSGVGGPLFLKGSSGPTEPGPSRAPALRTDVVKADGVVEGVRPEVALRPEVAGTIAAIAFRENQEVARGAVLAELHNETQKQQVALAEAELAVAEADLERVRNGERPERRRALAAVEEARRALYLQARGTLERSRRLADTRATSPEQRDVDYHRMLQTGAELAAASAERALAEAPPRADELAAARGRVAAARARLRLAQAELARTRLVAPSGGRVLQVYAEVGELAGPASARPVLLMADLSEYRVRAFVEELGAGRVKAGQPVVVTAEGLPGKEFRGTVVLALSRMGRRAPQSDAPNEYKDLYYREVVISLYMSDGLTLNQRVQTRIELGPAEDLR